MNSLLEAEHVTIRFGRLTAVADASLTLAAGETLGLVGESGSGKSSLAKALIGLVPVTAGRISIEGHDLATLDRAGRLRLRRRAQIVLQDAAASLSPRFTVARLIAEPLRIHRLADSGMPPLIERLGLADLLDRYPHELSGGQAKRVALARALVLTPELLVADEPTAGLDISVQGEMLNLLIGLRPRPGLLLVSHDLSVIRRVSDRLAVLYLGRIVETGPTRTIFNRPAHPYAAGLIASAPVIDPERRQPRRTLSGELPSPFAPPPGCAFHPRCPQAQAICRRVVPVAQAVGEGREVACHFPLTEG
ncbi:MAG: peptide/nickel transport system ATP-binding protein [Aliidongia sp.]|jgi:peptide/nickel transport system ATP-binding protein|nr:peptide/nickel transport system ATP-binding protein [Aliidongia sp.]